MWNRCTKNYFQKSIKRTEETTGGFIGNKITNKITKISRNSPQNSLETVTSETENVALEREISVKYIYLQKKERKLLMI